jgi:hypothetical protein
MTTPLIKREKMQPVMIRLPIGIREKARQIAENASSDEDRYTESDVYRTAIQFFLSRNFTVSKDEAEKQSDE